VRMPFGKLVELVSSLPEEDWNLPMGKLAERWGEPSARIGDAIDAMKMLRGELTYLPVVAEPDEEGNDGPVN